MSSFTDKMIDSFKTAINLYIKSIDDKYSSQKNKISELFTTKRDPWVLFVVENSERNVID